VKGAEGNCSFAFVENGFLYAQSPGRRRNIKAPFCTTTKKHKKRINGAFKGKIRNAACGNVSAFYSFVGQTIFPQREFQAFEPSCSLSQSQRMK